MKILKCENIFEKYFSRLPWKFYSGEELHVNAYQCRVIASAFRSAFDLDGEIGMNVDPFDPAPARDRSAEFFKITENKKARLCFFDPGSRPDGIIGFFQLFEVEDSEEPGEKTKFSKERIWFLIESVEDAAKVCGYFGRASE